MLIRKNWIVGLREPSYLSWDDGTDGGGGSGGDGGTGDAGSKSDDKGGSGDAGSGDKGDKNVDPPGGDDGLSLDGLDDKTKAYIKKLRKENASYRNQAKNLQTTYNDLNTRFSTLEGGLKKALGVDSDKDLSPDEQVAVLQGGLQEAVTQNEILSLAVENNIGKDGLKYFQFLVNDRIIGLEEGEELTEDDLAEIAQEARAKTGGQTSTSTSVGGNGKTNPNPNDKKDGVTLDQFVNMSISDKSALYQKNQPLYLALMAEAKQKRMLVHQ